MLLPYPYRPPRSHKPFPHSQSQAMGSISRPALFEPIKVGNSQLNHRVVFAPCTRVRATPGTHIPSVPLMKTYYEQRASVPGTLIISEGTLIAEKASGMDNVPGIWSKEQIAAWREVSSSCWHRNSELVSDHGYHVLSRSRTLCTLKFRSFTSNCGRWVVRHAPSTSTAIPALGPLPSAFPRPPPIHPIHVL